jgi:type III secretion system chaperone SycN
MQDLQHALAHFGESLGLKDFGLGADGHARINLSNGGAIGLEARGDALLLSRVTPVPFIRPRALLAALQASHARQYPSPTPVAVGLSGEGNDAAIVVSCLLEPAHIGPAAIGQALDGLAAWMRDWQASQQQNF